MAASIPKLASLNTETQSTITKAKAVADEIKKVMEPYGDM
jgi:hypothetical protein